MKRTQVGLISLALLLAGIGLRLPGLSGYLTPDEHLWAGRTAQFMLALADRDWSTTSTSGHPGVTTTWAGSIGVTLRYLLRPPADATSLRTMAEALAADTTSLDYLPWLRLPILVICAVGGVLLFWLSRRLMGDAIAMTAALFVLLDPFWLAHSKIIHLDALLTLTATLAWLSVLLATRTHATEVLHRRRGRGGAGRPHQIAGSGPGAADGRVAAARPVRRGDERARRAR